MTDKGTIDRRGPNHKQRTTYLLEDWLKDPAWSGGTQLGRGTLVHDSKSRERSTWAPRSWMTTAVVFLYIVVAPKSGESRPNEEALFCV